MPSLLFSKPAPRLPVCRLSTPALPPPPDHGELGPGSARGIPLPWAAALHSPDRRAPFLPPALLTSPPHTRAACHGAVALLRRLLGCPVGPWTLGFNVFPSSSVGKESAWNARKPSSIPGLGRSPGEGIGYPLQYSWASLVAQVVKSPPGIARGLGSIPGLGRSPGEGKGYPLPCCGLENPMDCMVHGFR